MKRKCISFLTFLFVLIMSFCLCSCKQEVEPVVIDLTGTTVEENATLLSVMKEKQSEGAFTFIVENGMITEINGTKNAINYNPCWMLYTSDAAFSSAEYGSYEYEGALLGSAILGAGELLVKTGEIYVWVYQSF